MDSVSHTTVAHYLLDYAEQNEGISFQRKAFCFGNLKPDLKGEYLTKRHYPSLMFDEVMQRIRDFAANYHIGDENSAKLSEELGVICHYITDFFSFPHNDDIYERGLFAHYVYEKRTSLTISKRIDSQRFADWAEPVRQDIPQSVEALIAILTEQHKGYVAQAYHGIDDDVAHICCALSMLMLSMIRITQTAVVPMTVRASVRTVVPA